MAIPKYYVRPDGLHETIIRIDGKRKAFRGKSDREVWNKVKAYRAERDAGKTETFEAVAHAWWNEIEPTLEENTKKGYRPAYHRAVAQFGAEDVAAITTEMIETYVRQFAKTYAKKSSHYTAPDHPPNLVQGRPQRRYQVQPSRGRAFAKEASAEKAPRARTRANPKNQGLRWR